MTATIPIFTASASTAPASTAPASTTPTFTMLGDDAGVCIGDSCAVPPAQQATAMVNDLVDSGEV